jgi:hypothetical protein
MSNWSEFKFSIHSPKYLFRIFEAVLFIFYKIFLDYSANLDFTNFLILKGLKYFY